MATPRQDLEALFERATEQIRDSAADRATVEAAAERVWSRLTAGPAEDLAAAAAVEEIRGCADYRTLIPAYLAGSLPEARRLLLEDHTRECVPCRKALKAARSGEPLDSLPAPPVEAAGRVSFGRWALAATAVVGIGLALFLFWQLGPFFGGPVATVRTVDGQLFRVASTSHLPVAEGEEVALGERLRTGREGGSVVELADGSLVEMRSRTEMAIRRGRRGTTLDLQRGSVIVQAAPQGSGHLYVATDDCLVSVTGTIFSVNHGTKGSRVSVIEGEVRVDFAGEEQVLEPGEQVATQSSLTAVPVADEISWSRDVDHYIQVLQELTDLRRDLRQAVARPGRRYTSRLLDLVPEHTVFYAALPNLGETVGEAHRVIQERIAESPALSQWWSESEGAQRFGPQIDEVVDTISEFGEYLGDELVVAGYLKTQNDFGGPVVLAELVDPAGLRDFVERQLAAHPEIDGEVSVTFVDDPFAPVAGQGVYLWLDDGLLVGSADIADVRRVAAVALGRSPNPFVGSPFYTRLAEIYHEGAEIVVAADLELLVASSLSEASTAEDRSELLDRLGVANVQHLILEQKQGTDGTHHRAVLTFHEGRRGMAAWLAEPAPMGSLAFISPDAKLVSAVVFKDPVALLDELYGMMAEGGSRVAEELHGFETRHGLSLRDDFAASIGGELAFALDGPMLPSPGWKVVIEVYDPARFQWTVEQAIVELNQALTREGEPGVALAESDLGGRTVYSFTVGPVEVDYTYVEGYLLAAPSRALLDRAIRHYESGYTIVDSGRFTALLPTDGRENFSALLYQDVAGLLEPLAERYAQGGQLTDDQRQALEEVRSRNTPSLACIYGEPDRIILAATSDVDVLGAGLLGVLGISDPLGLEALGSLVGDGSGHGG